ncbi:cation:proton antiporter [Alcaligenaceae bacterium 429]|nr:cation:proton antiporter [Alcaligenaceae bacterium 429]
MNDIPLWISIPTALLLILSGIITLVGSLGLIRLRHFFSRMHAPTLGNTLGVFFMLLAMVLMYSYLSDHVIVHPLLITLLLVITSPVTAILLMRAAIKRELSQRTVTYAPNEPGHMDLPHKSPPIVEQDAEPKL